MIEFFIKFLGFHNILDFQIIHKYHGIEKLYYVLKKQCDVKKR